MQTKKYKGICETTSNKRYVNHEKSLNLIKSKTDTTLSIEYWNLKTKTASTQSYMGNQVYGL